MPKDKVIQFRVLIDYDEDVFRDIEISTNDTFLTLHTMIQEAFGFDNSQMASFYESNEEWEKGQEITLMEVMEPSEGGAPIWNMHDVLLSKIIIEKGQKLLYVFDFFLLWCFYIDVINIREIKDHVIIPRISNSFGIAPDQYNKSADLIFEGEEIVESDEDDDLSALDEFDEMFKYLGDDETLTEYRDLD